MLTFTERYDLGINFRNLKLIDSIESKLQKILLYVHPLLGKILVINNEVQHVEKWAPLYHEMIIHLPAAFVPTIRDVLILGGGSLFAAFEVLKYKSVKKVTLIDHDEKVITIIRNNYPHALKVLNDKRFKLVINDAFDEIKNQGNHYDLIINDSVDLIDHSRKVNSNLLEILTKSLNKNGISSDVVYRNIFEKKTTLKTIDVLKKEYFYKFSLTTVPEYPGIFHVLCLWSNSNKYLMKNDLVNDIQRRWVTSKKFPCVFYNPSFLNFYCYLPSYLKTILYAEKS